MIVEGRGVYLRMPLPEQQVFRYEAMDDILELLVRNPEIEFGVTQLREVTGHGGETVSRALDLLKELELVEIRHEGQRRLVEANPKRARFHSFGLNEVPEKFYGPVYAFLKLQEQALEGLKGIVLFGSIARGEADRRSDIDLFVLVDENATATRRSVQDIVQQLEEQRFDGDRYDYHVVTESIESALNYHDRLRPIFSEGIVLYETDDLHRVKEAIFDA
jgi:predicted nucleotidyltransferase